MLQLSMWLNCYWKYVKPQKITWVRYVGTLCLASNLFVTASLSLYYMRSVCVYGTLEISLCGKWRAACLKGKAERTRDWEIMLAPSNILKAAKNKSFFGKYIWNTLNMSLVSLEFSFRIYFYVTWKALALLEICPWHRFTECIELFRSPNLPP